MAAKKRQGHRRKNDWDSFGDHLTDEQQARHWLQDFESSARALVGDEDASSTAALYARKVLEDARLITDEAQRTGAWRVALLAIVCSVTFEKLIWETAPRDPYRAILDSDKEDEVREVLSAWNQDAQHWLQRAAGNPDSPDNGRMQWVAGRQLERYADLQAAADRLDLWEAIDAALYVGLMAGFQQAFPSETRHRLAALQATERWQKASEKLNEITQQRVLGGRKRRKAPSDDDLAAQVSAMHERHPKMSWTECCRQVGQAQQPKLSRSVVAKRAISADWRKKAAGS